MTMHGWAEGTGIMVSQLVDQIQGERKARMALSMITEPDDRRTGALVNRVGAVETIRLIETTDAMPWMNRVDAMSWREVLSSRIDDSVPRRIAEAEQNGIGTVIPGDPDWPVGLGDLGARTPFVLWTQGASSLLSRPLPDMVMFTGARASTSYGDHATAELVGDLAADEHVIVSGGAYGIDTAAHRAALASGGDTIAVMAGGVDRSYPAGNSDLFDRIRGVGVMVSEVSPGSAPTKHRFFARGRLMAALAGASVLVEAGARSGVIRAMTEAHLLGRAVGAVPGPVTSATSTGAHQLIKDGVARLVEHAGDITDMLTARPSSSRLDRSMGFAIERNSHCATPGNNDLRL